jgi:tol-pal system protein YbgF
MRLVARFLLASLVLGGCAHAEAAADRHASDMRDSIGKLEAEQDQRVARVDEGTPASKRAPAPNKPIGPQSVQIGDDGAPESDDPNDPTARPEIRLQGTASGRPTRSKSRAQPDERPSDRAPVLDPEAKRAYDAALAQVNAKQYDRALESLSAFLVRYPDHPYAENATYWRGECFYARGEYLRAAEQFEAVVTRGGNKAPDALLKLGASHERLGAGDRAKEYWDRLRRDYPRSDAAKKIPATDSKKESR